MDPSRPITEQELNKLRYLKASLQESQRMTPVVIGTSRLTTQDVAIGGYKIPKGTHLSQIGQV